MKRRERVLLTFIALIVLIATLYIFTNWFSIVTGYFGGESEQDKIVECLNNKNSELYSNGFCKECEEQKMIFGKSFGSIKYVDCGKDKENCPNIREIPAWYIDKEIYYGFKDLEELKSIAAC